MKGKNKRINKKKNYQKPEINDIKLNTPEPTGAAVLALVPVVIVAPSPIVSS